VPEGVEMLRFGGRYLEIGCISRGRTVEFDPSSLVWGSKTIIGVVMYDPWVIPRALEFLGRCRGRYPFDRLVSHTYPLDRIDEAFRDAEWYNREAVPSRITRAALAP
jgi:Zn-dependent alcohol dehydrogenase